MRKKGYASLRCTDGFFLTMFMLPLTLCLLEWRLRLPLVVVASLVLCFLVHIFQSTALIASVFVCVYRCKTKTHYFNMIDSLHIKTKQNAKFTRPQVGTARKERQRQQQAVFMLGGLKKRKKEAIHAELKEKTIQRKGKNVCAYNRLSGLSSNVGCSSRRRRRHWSGSYEVFPESSSSQGKRTIGKFLQLCCAAKLKLKIFQPSLFGAAAAATPTATISGPLHFGHSCHIRISRAPASQRCASHLVCVCVCSCNLKVDYFGLSLLAAFRSRSKQRWHVPSRPLVNPLEVKLLASSWPPRQPVNRHHPPAAWRSPIVIVPELLLCVRSVVTRNRLSCSSANCRSSVWCVKLPRISRLICVFSRQPLVPFRWVRRCAIKCTFLRCN